MVTSGIDLVTSNITAQSMMNDKRSSLATGHGSAPGSHILPVSSPLNAHAPLLASVSASGRAGTLLGASAASSPMAGTMASHHHHHQLDHSGHVCTSVPLQHSTGPYGLGPGEPTMHPGYTAYLASRGVTGGGTLSSNAGSHPSSLTGATSGLGSATGVVATVGPVISNLATTGMTYSTDQSPISDGLVVARNGHLGNMECGHEQSFEMQHLGFDSKSEYRAKCCQNNPLIARTNLLMHHEHYRNGHSLRETSEWSSNQSIDQPINESDIQKGNQVMS